MSDVQLIRARIAAFDAEMALLEIEEIKGGAGSGNWGHAGRPGKKGGSAPVKGPTARSMADNINPAMSLSSGKDAAARQAAARAGKGQGNKDPLQAAQQRHDKAKKTWSDLKKESLKWGYDPDNMTDKDFDFWAKYNPADKGESGVKMAEVKEFAARVKAAKQEMAEANQQLTDATAKNMQKPASGAPPTGDAVNNDKARKWMAGGVEKGWGDSYGEANADLKNVVNASHDSRGQHKDEIAKRLSEKSGLSYEKVDAMVKKWAGTSADHDVDSLQMQVAAARYLGIEPDPFVVKRLKEQGGGQGSHTDDERQAFLKAMHTHTQEQLAAAGFKPTDTVRLHRGVDGIIPDGVTHGDVINLEQNALTSWSLSMGVAKTFAPGYLEEHRSGMLTMDVPVSAIIGSCKTGIGCLIEAEVVVGDTGGHKALVRDKRKISRDYQDVPGLDK